MRWMFAICAAAIAVVALYAAAIIAANRGVDLAWFTGATRLPEGLTSCERSPRFQNALREYEAAKQQVRASNYSGANSSLDRGIADLGNSYEQNMLDDTGEYLGLAHIYDRSGKAEIAAREKCSVLRDRLETCGETLQNN